MQKSSSRVALDSGRGDPVLASSKGGAREKRILLTALAKWLVTVSFAASIYIVLWAYSSKDAMVSKKKREFNVVVTGLSIGLGLSTASSLKGMVRELRWWLLSLREYSSKEIELISKSEHLSCLIQLGWVSRDLIVRSFVLFWLSINLAAQIAVATIGLTYNVDPADKMAVTTPGMVYIPDMSVIQPVSYAPDKTPALGALRYTANKHGLYADTLTFGVMADVPRPGTIDSSQDASMYCEDGAPRCSYVFYESAPVDVPGVASPDLRVATDRSVASETTCTSQRVIRGGDGWNMTITLDDGPKTEIDLPTLNGPNQTLFMTDSNQNLTTRWSIVTAFEASTTDPWYYKCNVSIGAVTNAVVREHNVSALVATMASSGIALQGYGAAFTFTNDSKSQDQFQSYPVESWYGLPQAGNATTMASLLSQFAIGVVASLARYNGPVEAPGLTPLETITLKIFDWKYVHLNLGLIAGLQLLLGGATVWIASSARAQHSPRDAYPTPKEAP